MQCSQLAFLASQALYGRMISKPDWTDEQLVDSSIKLALNLNNKIKHVECNSTLRQSLLEEMLEDYNKIKLEESLKASMH